MRDFSDLVRRAMRSRWWPWAVLAVFAALIALVLRSVLLRGLPLPLVLLSGTAVAVVTGAVLEFASARLVKNRALLTGLAAVSVVGLGLLVMYIATSLLGSAPIDARHLGVIGAAAMAVGLYLTAISDRRVLRDHTALAGRILVAAAVLSSILYLDAAILNQPMRDTRLYLRAGHLFLDHQAVYLVAPLKSTPTDQSLLPYLYPPFTLPLVAGLAMLPERLAIGIMLVGLTAAVIAGLRLLGVRWRMVPLLLLTPPLAIGIQVGNVACVAFLILAAGWRASWSLPLAGTFKAQTGLLSLWLVRERRWRALLVGVGILAALILVTLPLTGVGAYVHWVKSLVYFQQTAAARPGLLGLALQRSLPTAVVLLLAVAAIGVAIVGRRRDGLARFAIASVVISPTVYAHGLAFFLPAILFLDASVAWAMIGLIPWGGIAWWVGLVAMAALALGLTRVAGRASEVGEGEAEELRSVDDLHPLGALMEPWPD